MAAVDSLPRSGPERGDSFNDEKLDEKNEKGDNSSIEIAQSIKGEVYDDVRAIDVDEDGKERPIREFLDYA